MPGVQYTHPIPRKYLELIQDIIVFGLCMMLFAAMLESMIRGALVVGDILLILVLFELFRLLLIYLEEHRVSVETMVEVGIVSTLREVILKGALHIEWPQLLVVSVFVITLGRAALCWDSSALRSYMSDVGQPILAAAAFQAASLLVIEVSALQPQDRFQLSSTEPPRRRLQSRLGCPTSLYRPDAKLEHWCTFLGGDLPQPWRRDHSGRRVLPLLLPAQSSSCFWWPSSFAPTI